MVVRRCLALEDSIQMNARDYQRQFPHLQFETLDDSILLVTISNPPKRNATSCAMHTELTHVWNVIDRDPQVACVLLQGEGESFCAGGEFEMMEQVKNDPATRVRVANEAKDLVYNMLDCSKPIVSAVRGPAYGTGLAMVVMADVSVVSKTASFMDGHARLGLAAGDHAVLSWPLLIGMAKAKYYLLTNEAMDGETADRLGLVSMCVDDSLVNATAVKVARQLAAGSESAMHWTKQTLNDWYKLGSGPFEASVAYESLGFDLPDFAEGYAALRARRAPLFKRPLAR